ncbi:hypothetical protein [Synechococcus sp. PCC 7335]|uniref:hypothetical protein n=1 Tax=Synechococcus sp. (strain ATCC 29403 / PCC 7335) TaxID=91464 RepID=UPI0012F8C4B3|nr:hypothetical protein [Synechococcus sp. PCC 7335]
MVKAKGCSGLKPLPWRVMAVLYRQVLWNALSSLRVAVEHQISGVECVRIAAVQFLN